MRTGNGVRIRWILLAVIAFALGGIFLSLNWRNRGPLLATGPTGQGLTCSSTTVNLEEILTRSTFNPCGFSDGTYSNCPPLPGSTCCGPSAGFPAADPPSNPQDEPEYVSPHAETVCFEGCVKELSSGDSASWIAADDIVTVYLDGAMILDKTFDDDWFDCVCPHNLNLAARMSGSSWHRLTVVYQNLGESNDDDVDGVTLWLGSRYKVLGDDYTISYSPTAGPLGSRVEFEVSPGGSQLFDGQTSLSFTGTFQPDGYSSSSEFTVSYDPWDVQLVNSNKVAISLGSALPTSSFFLQNLGLRKRVEGTLDGVVTLHLDCASYNLDVDFDVEASTTFGELIVGTNNFTPVQSMFAAGADSQSDITEIVANSTWTYRGQIVVPKNGIDTDSAPSTMTASIMSFSSTGSVVSDVPDVVFARVSSTSTEHTYRTTKPVVPVNDPSLDGNQASAVVVHAPGHSSIVIVVPPPSP